jgi:hypothetical protein
MTRLLLTLSAVLVLASPQTAWSAVKAAKPKARSAPTSSIAKILDRSGAARETMALRDLVSFGVTADDPTAYAERRAAIRACHAERYATARDNVLAGRSAPLRDC